MKTTVKSLTLVLTLACAAGAAFPSIAGAKPSKELREASAYMKTAFGTQCSDRDNPDGPPVTDTVYNLSYRESWMDASEPDKEFKLFQMSCYSGPYNFAQVYLTRDEDGQFSAISFAEPSADYQYTDDNQVTLKAPPVVTGISATPFLINSEFDEKSQTITSFGKWRGIGDAWDAGTWTFKEGTFYLTKYVVDPTFSANADSGNGDEMDETSYEIYPTVKLSTEAPPAQ
jgi:hypothetical protein